MPSPKTPGREPAGAGRARSTHGILWHTIIGFLMGTADLVPGVSGGTVALAGGIYARLIAAIHEGTAVLAAFASGRPKEAFTALRSLDWSLLLPLLGGIGLAIVTLASTIERLLESAPVRIGGLFLGLVLGSVIVSFRMLRCTGRQELVLAVMVAGLVFGALGLVPDTQHGTLAADPPLWAYGAAGALAICAMILPGVSGSFMLVSVGMYDNVLGAVNGRSLLPLAVFAGGCVVGLAAFSRLLFWLIKTHHDRVVAAMIGIMLGSVRILWPWPGGPLTSELGRPVGDVLGPAALALLGFAGVLAVARLTDVAEEPAETG